MTKSVNQVSTKNEECSFLPARSNENSSKERIFRTSVIASEYTKLEIEATERGITPFKLSGLIISAYIQGKINLIDQ